MMFERFTDKARRAVRRAQQEARDLNHGSIGTEHILLGLADVPDCVAMRVLRSAGFPPEMLRVEIDSLVPKGPTPVTRKHIPFTPTAKRCLELSLREALKLGHNYIGTEHILLGLFAAEDDVPVQIFRKVGLDLETLRARVVELAQIAVEERDAEAFGGAPGTAGRRRGRREVAPAGEPLCPQCEALLSHTATFRIVEATEQDGDGTAQVLFLFCRSCGRMIDDVILPGE